MLSFALPHCLYTVVHLLHASKAPTCVFCLGRRFGRQFSLYGASVLLDIGADRSLFCRHKEYQKSSTTAICYQSTDR